jgi:hypothetical protein
MARLTAKCAHCGIEAAVGTVLVPYLVETKVRKRVGEDGKETTERKPVHRWLCGLQTGRDCAEAWHAKFRAWRKERAA